MRTGLCWLRRDLRLYDHPALSEALKENDRVYVAFIFDDAILLPILKKATQDRRVQFICQSLVAVNRGLVSSGGGVILRRGNPVEIIPKLMQELGADTLYFNRDYSPYALTRDTAVTQDVERSGYSVRSFKDHVMAEPHEIMTQSGTPYRVFTPYSKAWFARFPMDEAIPTWDVEFSRLAPVLVAPEFESWEQLLAYAGFQPDSLDLPGGTLAGRVRLNEFAKILDDYDTRRNYFADEGTSRLSVYLRHGCVSVRECLNMAILRPSEGSRKWITEFIWREFYQMIFFHFPWVNDRPFQAKYHDLKVTTSEAYLAAFKAGMTGYPLIDAAMRCLNQTGWMHNRLRMVVASFLTKILLVDWKRGERYFSWKLLDYELQSNNGGWQWAAGIGCDAVPYFRIFNPVTQSKDYDPDGEFIRRYCPELRVLNRTQIHCPAEAKSLPNGFILGRDYPQPIVAYKSQRQAALILYR